MCHIHKSTANLHSVHNQNHDSDYSLLKNYSWQGSEWATLICTQSIHIYTMDIQQCARRAVWTSSSWLVYCLFWLRLMAAPLTTLLELLNWHQPSPHCTWHALLEDNLSQLVFAILHVVWQLEFSYIYNANARLWTEAVTVVCLPFNLMLNIQIWTANLCVIHSTSYRLYTNFAEIRTHTV